MTRTMHTPALTLLNASPRMPLLAQLAVRFAATVTIWEQRRRTRVNLSYLDDRLLKDVGLDRRSATHECRRHFWDL